MALALIRPTVLMMFVGPVRAIQKQEIFKNRHKDIIEMSGARQGGN
ncbi:hypothetical protein UYSO10_4601 [Kosakonia radicincitans]|nr:hypothetical protein UYSO10_4601 [Kosakonia radicincitans]